MSFISILHVSVSQSDILCSGRMYHVKKEGFGHWKAIYSVVKDLNVLKQVNNYCFCNYNYFQWTCMQYFKEEYPNAEPGDDVDSFNFVQPNGVLQLHLQTPQQLGWIVNPEREPMEVYSS